MPKGFIEKGIAVVFLITVFTGFSCVLAEDNSGDNFTFNIDCSKTIGELEMFWNASGLAMDYNNRLQHQNMYLLGSVPYEAMMYQRPHSLLDLVKVSDMDSNNPKYDFSKLDKFLDVIVRSGQKLFFEIMGNPSKHFANFHEDRQLRQWKELVRTLAQHLIDRYGKAEVRSWYFETWNEPDGDYRWKWDHQEFYNYYDACSLGLQEADPQLKFGGPGVASRNSDYYTGLVEHCMEGTNYFTGQKGTRIDFISYHNKKTHPQQTDRDIEAINMILDKYPQLANRPFVNNEADVKCCWKDDDKPWREDNWYAAYVARQMPEHWYRIIKPMGIDFRLANDNAFLGEWKHRTNFKWFGGKDDFVLIKQAVHNQMIMLSLLGDTVLSSEQPDFTADVGIFPTARRGQVAVLVYSYDTDHKRTGSSHLTLNLKNLPFKNACLAYYVIDENHSNAYELWKRLGSPQNPTAEQIQKMRNGQELELGAPLRYTTVDSFSFNAAVPLHSSALLLITEHPQQGPGPVTGLYAEKFDGLVTGNQDVLLRFEHLPRTVKTYEILRAKTRQGPFNRINRPDILCTSFIDSKPVGETYWYTVRARDCWNRTGDVSNIVKVE